MENSKMGPDENVVLTRRQLMRLTSLAAIGSAVLNTVTPLEAGESATVPTNPEPGKPCASYLDGPDGLFVANGVSPFDYPVLAAFLAVVCRPHRRQASGTTPGFGDILLKDDALATCMGLKDDDNHSWQNAKRFLTNVQPGRLAQAKQLWEDYTRAYNPAYPDHCPPNSSILKIALLGRVSGDVEMDEVRKKMAP